jgi:hypothetical protein
LLDLYDNPASFAADDYRQLAALQELLDFRTRMQAIGLARLPDCRRVN